MSNFGHGELEEEIVTQELALTFTRHPNEVGENMLKELSIMTDVNGASYIYNGIFWEPVTSHQLRQKTLDYDTPTSKASRRKEICDFICTKTIMALIPWNNISNEQIAVKNGVLNYRTHDLVPHQKEHYLNKVIDINFQPDETCPMWLEVLSELLGDGSEKIQALQRFFGYVLMPHARFKKALICHGPSNTGKSLIAEVLRLMIGASNVCSIQLEHMDDPRALAPIKNKMLNVIPELPERVTLAEGGFKQLVSTGDPVQIDPKHKSPELILPSCKHAIFTNSLPRIRDTSNAVYNRLLLIQLTNVISPEKQDKDLIYWLKQEREGIFNWALKGAQQLLKANGTFSDGPSVHTELQAYRASENPVLKWAEARLSSSRAEWEYIEDLYTDFVLWYTEKDCSRDRFSKCLRDAGYLTVRKKIQGRNHTVLPNYQLIRQA